MAQRRRCERVEVRRAGRDEAPVGDVTERRESVAPQAAEPGLVGGEARDDRDRTEQQEQCRKEATSAAAVEVAEVELALSVVLAQEQRGDEVTREHEED